MELYISPSIDSVPVQKESNLEADKRLTILNNEVHLSALVC